MVISFFGHSDFCEKEKYAKSTLDLLFSICKDLDNIDFLLGGYGNFDYFAYDLCAKIKNVKNDVKLNFVTPYLGNFLDNRPFLKKRYDQIIYPELENVPNKFAIIKRNEWMINQSDLIICFVSRSFGGAYNAFKYAKTKNKRVINIFKND